MVVQAWPTRADTNTKAYLTSQKHIQMLWNCRQRCLFHHRREAHLPDHHTNPATTILSKFLTPIKPPHPAPHTRTSLGNLLKTHPDCQVLMPTALSFITQHPVNTRLPAAQ